MWGIIILFSKQRMNKCPNKEIKSKILNLFIPQMVNLRWSKNCSFLTWLVKASFKKTLEIFKTNIMLVHSYVSHFFLGLFMPSNRHSFSSFFFSFGTPTSSLTFVCGLTFDCDGKTELWNQPDPGSHIQSSTYNCVKLGKIPNFSQHQFPHQ